MPDENLLLQFLMACGLGFTLFFVLHKAVAKRFHRILGVALLAGTFVAIELSPAAPGITFIFIALPVVSVALIIGKTRWL